MQGELLDFSSCWIVFIHVVRGCPGGLLQFSKGEAVKIFLASVLSGITNRCFVPYIYSAWLSGTDSLSVLFHTWLNKAAQSKTHPLHQQKVMPQK